jgi:hypothetical protein
MKNQRAKITKLAGVAAMATLVTTAGWGVAAGTAQADVGQVSHNISVVRVHHFNPFNPVRPGRHIFREGGPVDRFFDHFFNDDRMMRL